MASATLVDEIEKIVERLRQARGELVLAMLYSSFEGGDGGWNFIVSAPWTDKLGMVESIRVLAEALRSGLSKENISEISRVTPLETGDPFVRAITSVISAAGPGTRANISNSNFGGVPIPRGILFYSQREAPGTSSG